ncbi:MAG: apolipoprotein N-acyltransferase [Planctomycetes bacterium]|nr:apolipoprotein N-acyltransferase [Planctomycetota bacterium]
MSVLLALLSGALSGFLVALAFPPAALWPLGWVGLAPLFRALGRSTPGGAAAAGGAFGLVSAALAMSWLTVPTAVGWIAVALYFGLFYAALGPVLRAVCVLRNRFGPVLVAAAWVGGDLLIGRLFTGIPWLMVGYSQVERTRLIQIADVTGVHGVTFLTALSAAVIAAAWDARERPRRGLLAPLGLWAALAIATLVYGEMRGRQFGGAAREDGPWVAAVQPNIPQALKDSAVAVEGREVFERNDRLSLEAAGADPRPDLIVWAETMNPAPLYPLGPGDDPPYGANRLAFATLARARYRTALLLGTLYYTEPLRRGAPYPPFHNSAILFTRDGRESGRYDKLHPIPWAEYIPLGLRFVGDILERYAGFDMKMIAGREPVVFRFGPEESWSFGALVCFDVIHARTACRMVAGGARFLVNLTNEAWFGESAEFDQLLGIARFRAVENRVSLVRATNSGISCLIDARGDVVARVRDRAGRDRGVGGVLRCRVPVRTRPAVYTVAGDAFAVSCAVLGLAAVLASAAAGLRSKRRKFF